MDWNGGSAFDPASNASAFDHLLKQLSILHHDACARNTHLELQIARNASQAAFESKVDDPWLPIHFLAPDDTPLPRRLPWGKQSPRSCDAQDTDVSARQQERLSQSIDFLARQQENLSVHILKVLTSNPVSKNIQPEGQHVVESQQESKSIVASIEPAKLVVESQQVFESEQVVEGTTSPQGQITELVPPDSHETIDAEGGELVPPDSGKTWNTAASAQASTAASIGGVARALKNKDLNIQHINSREVRGSQISMHSASEHAERINRFKVATGGTREFGKHITTMLDAPAEESLHIMWRIYLRRMLIGPRFNIVISLVIVAYAVLIATETDMIAHNPDLDSAEIKMLHYVFSITFFGEFVLRCVAEGWDTLYGIDAFWNRLDVLLISCSIVEVILEITMGITKSAASAVRLIRMGRICRTVRLIRTFRQFHDFQKMAHALISSFKTLVCSLVLLVFVMFFFAVWLTQNAANVEKREQIQDLELRYGTLMSTFFTLFLSVSGGISWDLCYWPLHELSWLSKTVFILYICIVFFGVLNVVTSVFVESVIRSVQHQRDLIVQDKEEAKKIAADHVREVFRFLDSDGSGRVGIEDMEYFFGDPNLRKYMDALDIETEDTRLLFKLLDHEASGSIGVEDFVDGCLRMRGNARSIDVHALTFRIKNFFDRWTDFTHHVHETLTEIRRSQYSE